MRSEGVMVWQVVMCGLPKSGKTFTTQRLCGRVALGYQLCQCIELRSISKVVPGLSEVAFGTDTPSSPVITCLVKRVSMPTRSKPQQEPLRGFRVCFSGLVRQDIPVCR